MLHIGSAHLRSLFVLPNRDSCVPESVFASFTVCGLTKRWRIYPQTDARKSSVIPYIIYPCILYTGIYKPYNGSEENNAIIVPLQTYTV